MALRAGYKGLKAEEITSIKTALETLSDLLCTEMMQGSYVLTALVDSEGEVTYSWESAELII